MPATRARRHPASPARSRWANALARALRPSFRRRPPDAYFVRAEFQAHFASLLDARNADPDFRMWGDPYTFVRWTVAPDSFARRNISGDSPESNSIWAPAVRRAGVSALTSASTGTPGPQVRSGGDGHIAVHHCDPLADSV